jgi:hypothetical protein
VVLIAKTFTSFLKAVEKPNCKEETRKRADTSIKIWFSPFNKLRSKKDDLF